jgi:hypothetical protein
MIFKKLTKNKFKNFKHHKWQDCTLYFSRLRTMQFVKIANFMEAELVIRDIFVRIRIRGSVPLTNGSRSDSFLPGL